MGPILGQGSLTCVALIVRFVDGSFSLQTGYRLVTTGLIGRGSVGSLLPPNSFGSGVDNVADGLHDGKWYAVFFLSVCEWKRIM